MFALFTAGTAFGAAAFAGIHAMAPKSQLYGKTFFGTPGQGKQLALTYDDGPNDAATPHLLDVLAKHDVKAAFFLIGKHVKQHPEIVRRIVAEEHLIGNHTFTHPNLALCSEQQIREELTSCEKALQEIGCPLSILPSGQKLFRPPFGGRRPATLRIARELGFLPVMWSVWCFDWNQTTTDRVEQHAIRRISGGDIIVLHDGGHKRMGVDRKHTVEATERLLLKYKGEGFEFVSIPKMLGQAIS